MRGRRFWPLAGGGLVADVVVGTAAPRRLLQSESVAGLLFDDIEREQFCDLLDELGPEAPTCLDPWTTHDIAAQLVLREHDFLAAPGLVVHGAWGRFAERRRLAWKEKEFEDLVATIRSGPPPGLFRAGWVRCVPNLNEFFVYHEDVRRANGYGPRTNPPTEDAALFHNVASAPRYPSRRLRGVGLELAWAGTDKVVRARRGQPIVRVHGLPGELLLFQFGRDAAQVEITGPPAAIAAVKRTQFGM